MITFWYYRRLLSGGGPVVPGRLRRTGTTGAWSGCTAPVFATTAALVGAVVPAQPPPQLPLRGENLLVLQAVVGRWWPGSSRTASANRYYRCLERLYRSGLSHHRNAGLAVVPGQPPAQLPLRGDNLLVLEAVVGRWWSGCSGWLRPTGTTGCSTGCTAWAFQQWYPVFTGCTGETTGCTAAV